MFFLFIFGLFKHLVEIGINFVNVKMSVEMLLVEKRENVHIILFIQKIKLKFERK